MKILLIGGTGLLSAGVAKQACNVGAEVYALNRGNRAGILPKEATSLKADIRSHEDVRRACKGLFFDVVIDFLSFKGTDIEERLSVLGGACNQFMFISSCAVYDIESQIGKCSEESPLGSPSWDYSLSKVEAEKTLARLCQETGLIYTIIRPGVTYGDTRIPYGIMPQYGYHWTLVERLLRKKPVLLWEGGQNTATITHVDDFAAGVVGLLGNSGAINEAVNIVSDTSYKWKEIIETLCNILNVSPVFADVPKSFLAEEMPERRGEVLIGRGLDAVFSNEKIKRILPGFTTSVSLNAGLCRTLDFYRKHAYLGGVDHKFDAEIDRIIQKYYRKADRVLLNEFNLKYMNGSPGTGKWNRAKYWYYRHGGSRLRRRFSVGKQSIGSFIRGLF